MSIYQGPSDDRNRNVNNKQYRYYKNRPFNNYNEKYVKNNLSTNLKGKNVEIHWNEINDDDYLYFKIEDFIYNLGELWVKLIPIEDKLSKDEMPQHLINTEIFVRLNDIKGFRIIKDNI